MNRYRRKEKTEEGTKAKTFSLSFVVIKTEMEGSQVCTHASLPLNIQCLDVNL